MCTLFVSPSNDSGVGILLEMTDMLVLLMDQLTVFADNEMVVEAASGLINVLTAAGKFAMSVYCDCVLTRVITSLVVYIYL